MRAEECVKRHDAVNWNSFLALRAEEGRLFVLHPPVLFYGKLKQLFTKQNNRAWHQLKI